MKLRALLVVLAAALASACVPEAPAPPSTVLDPCDPAILDLPWTEDQSFAGWLPPACFEDEGVTPIDGVRPIIGSPGHGA